MKLSSLNKGKILHFKGNNVVPVDIVDSGSDCETLPIILGFSGILARATWLANQSIGGRDGVLKLTGDGVISGAHCVYFGNLNLEVNTSLLKISYKYYIPSANTEWLNFITRLGDDGGFQESSVCSTTDGWTDFSYNFIVNGNLKYIYLGYKECGITSESIYIDNLKLEIYKLADRSTYHNNGIINGITFGSDRNGKADSAMVFDGNSYVDCGTSLDYSDKLTIACWIKPEVSTKFIFVKGDFSQTPIYDIGLMFVTTRGLRFYYGNTLYSDMEEVTSLSEYIFFAVIIDGTTIRFQKNDGAWIEKTLASTIPNTSLDLFIGALKNGTSFSNGFVGNKDELLIYNRVLTNSEISHLYESYNANAKVSSLKKGLILDMPLNSTYYNSTTKKVSDKTPKHNNGTASATGVTVFDDYMEFDGNDGKIDCGNTSNLDLTTLSIALWIKYNTSNERFVLNRFNVSETKGYNLFTLGEKIYWRVGNGTLNQTYKTLTNINDNWHLLSITWDNPTKTAKWYFEGNYFDSGVFDQDIATTTKEFVIGIWPDANNYDFIGGLAKLKIWNRVITEQEIKMLFNQERHLFGV